MEHFFPRIQVDTYAQIYARVKLMGGMQDVDHTQTIGGIQSNYLGGYIPPRVSAPLIRAKRFYVDEALIV